MRKNFLSKVFGVVAALTMATTATVGTAGARYTKDGGWETWYNGTIDLPSIIDNGGYYGRYYTSRGDVHCYGIQGMLNKYQNGHAFRGLDVDGILGPKSDDAIRKFQSSTRLSVDGIVGKDTYKKLVNKTGVTKYTSKRFSY
ncbi:MAG: peptidoglycan-binding protein [Ruminococcus sp.]|nr:peptidoglycan-binding protein [Ruminococcus sp.]